MAKLLLFIIFTFSPLSNLSKIIELKTKGMIYRNWISCVISNTTFFLYPNLESPITFFQGFNSSHITTYSENEFSEIKIKSNSTVQTMQIQINNLSVISI